MERKMVEDRDKITIVIKNNDIEGLKSLISTEEVDILKPIHSGLTPLMYAVLHCGNIEILELLAKSDECFFKCDCYNNSLLHLVTKTGNLELVQLLLDKGLNVNHLNNSSESPLQYACFWSDYEMVKLLIENGADINHIDCDDKRVFDWASKFSSFQIINYLFNQDIVLSDGEDIDQEFIELSTKTRRDLKKIFNHQLI